MPQRKDRRTKPALLLVPIMMILGAQVVNANEQVEKSSTEITFSSREILRCGNADFTSETVLTGLLENSRLAEIAGLDLSKEVLNVEYVSASSSVCTTLRSRSRQALLKLQQSRGEFSSGSVPPGWPESFISEYFKIGTKYFEVVLQTSEDFEKNLDPGEPLTQVWPGREGAVKIFDHSMHQIAVVDLMGEILE